MSQDISHVLSHWPYEDGEGLQVRIVEGRDGTRKLQIRIDLGLLQLETSGRPDGVRPSGRDSLLDHFRRQAEAYRRQHGWYEGFELTGDDCAALRQEALQFYHRRIALMALQEYPPAIADADHNLQILDLLKAFAHSRDDWMASEQYRAFIASHRVQSQVMQHLLTEDVRAALLEVQRGVRWLREIFAEQERLDEFEESAELAVLEELRRKLEGRYEVTHRQRLQIMLDEALRREDPDTVADLRAQLRQLETED
jgi:hypothetical protein